MVEWVPKQSDKTPTHSLCRTTDLQTDYSDAADGPSLNFCTRRRAGHTPRKKYMAALTEVELGDPSGYASPGGPVGGHSVESVRITKLFRRLVAPGLFFVRLRGDTHLDFKLLLNH